MNGNIFDIQHFSTGDGNGIRTTIFLKGCNLHCSWCHNPESLSHDTQLLYYKSLCVHCVSCAKVCKRQAHIVNEKEHFYDRKKCVFCGACIKACPNKALVIVGTRVSTNKILEEVLEDIDFYKSSQGGVTISGGEPLLQVDFCKELLILLKSYNIHTIVDTAGNVEFSSFEKILPYTNEFYFDIKATNQSDYTLKCGGDFNLIINNLTKLIKLGCLVTVRIPVIPKFNDQESYADKIAQLMVQCKVVNVYLLPFHGYAKSKYAALDMIYDCNDLSPPLNDWLLKLADVYKVYGINVKVEK